MLSLVVDRNLPGFEKIRWAIVVFLGNPLHIEWEPANKEGTQFNGPVYVLAKIIKSVMASAAKEEVG